MRNQDQRDFVRGERGLVLRIVLTWVHNDRTALAGDPIALRAIQRHRAWIVLVHHPHAFDRCSNRAGRGRVYSVRGGVACRDRDSAAWASSRIVHAVGVRVVLARVHAPQYAGTPLTVSGQSLIVSGFGRPVGKVSA